jgi:hypothetical protein
VAQEHALGLEQQLVAPVERRPQRLVPRQCRPPAASRQVEAIIEAGGDLLDAERADASSIASGMPSSRRQIAVNTAARRRSSAKCGSAARARSRNSPPAPYRRRSP